VKAAAKFTHWLRGAGAGLREVGSNEWKWYREFFKLPSTLAMASQDPECFDSTYYALQNPVRC
jgi:hypothetical protein